MTKQGTSTVLTQTLGYRNPTTTTTTAQVATLTNTASGYGKTYTYTYDDNGNILSVSDGTYTTSYVYDTANQLVRENNQQLGKTWTWTYNAAGNILSRKEYAYTTGTLGTPTDTVSYGYATSGWKDLLTSYDGFSYSYDTIGNPLFDGFWTYTWEHGRELESQYRIIALPDGRQMDVGISYVYDVNGMRTQKSILTRWFAGTTSAPVEYMVDEQYDYVYNGSSLSQLKVTKETTAGSGSPTTTTENLNFTYDASGTPMTVTHNGTTYYYVTNLQGDVTDILNASGTAVVSYTYDAWGNIRSTTGTLSATLGKYNPLRYRGYVYDTETKFYYLQSRYYNPETGRFLNADAFASTGQSFEGNNMFAYCGNDPVNYCDLNGMYRIWHELSVDHNWGYIHRCVQAHIIAKGIRWNEIRIPGVGRADIIDPFTYEVWEIKHGGSTEARIGERMISA